MGWNRLSIGVASVCFTSIFLFGEPAISEDAIGKDAILSIVRKNLYTAREDAIRLLEDSLQKDGSHVDHWIALIHALDVNDQRQFADRAARLALKTHPKHPELMMARAQVLSISNRAAAWDQLDDLEKLPGQQKRAKQLKEWLQLGLLHSQLESLPANRTAAFHADWATRLLERQQHDRFLKVVADGLKLNPRQPRLRELVPFAEVFAGRYEEALKVQSDQKFPQKSVGEWACLADALLFKGQPRFAIRSFGEMVPEDPGLKRILAIAHAELEEYDAAEKLLKQTAEDDLLRLNWDVARGREKSAIKRVPDLLLRHCTRGPGGSWAPPSYAARGGSRGRAYQKAIAWLTREFPDKPQAIFEAFGLVEPRAGHTSPWLPSEKIRRSARRYTAWLREAIPKAPADDRVAMRRVLAEQLADQHLYAEAAKVLAPNAVGQKETEKSINSDAVEWSLLRRRAVAEKLHESKPWKLVEARQLLAEFRCRTFNQERIGKTPWRKPEDVVAELQKLPPGIMAAVFEALEPNVINGQDRTPFVAVVRKFGTIEDAPILVSALEMTVRGEPTNIERRSGEELHDCLEQLTGANGPDDTPEKRVEFWVNWWRQNSARIAQ